MPTRSKPLTHRQKLEHISYTMGIDVSELESLARHNAYVVDMLAKGNLDLDEAIDFADWMCTSATNLAARLRRHRQRQTKAVGQ